MFKNPKKGVSLYLALMIMFILIAIGLGVSLIIVSQMKMIRGMGDSVVALYAADTGIERALYEKRANGMNWSGSDSVGGANYTVNYTENSEVRWQSSGNYKGTKRAIEVISPVVFDFNLVLEAPYGTGWAPDNLCIRPSDSTFTTVTTTHISGPTEDVTFSVSDSPSITSPVPGWPGCFYPLHSGETPITDLKACFSPAVCTISSASPTCSSTLTLSDAGGDMPLGTYAMKVSGAATDILTKQADIQLKVQNASCPV